jgi:molecular chaperone DnaK (HSP70)
MNEKGSFAIGIDFGTTQSRMAYMRRDRREGLQIVPLMPTQAAGLSALSAPNIWQTPKGNSIPSVVAVKRTEPRDGVVAFPLEIKIGAEAQKSPAAFQSFSRIKRFIGRGNKYKQDVSYRIGKDQTGEDYFVCPEGLVGRLISGMLESARQSPELRSLNTVNVTITAPARSTTGQRMATQFAAALAGFRGEIYVLEEPVAVFLYYMYTSPEIFEGKEDAYVLVFDFGGGTCDISIIRYRAKGLPLVVTRQMGEFGGEDIDDLITHLWLRRTRGRPGYNYDVLKEEKPHLLDELHTWARWAKEQLVNSPMVYVSIPSFYENHPGSFQHILRQDDLAKLLLEQSLVSHINDVESQAPIMAMINQLLDKAFKDADLQEKDMKLILMAGGSSYLAEVQKCIHQKFAGAVGEKAILIKNPDISVVCGATIHQFYRQHEDKKLRKVISPTLPSDLNLVYYHNPDNNEQRKILLGGKGEELPITCLHPDLRSKKSEKWINDVESVAGKILIRITQQTQKLHEAYIDVGTKTVQHLRVRYRVNEYGILEKLECIPANLLRGFFPKPLRFVEERVEAGVIGTDFNLDNYSVTNLDRIRLLREEYGVPVQG